MKKIPTLFVRDPEDMSRVINEVHPDCQWVINGEGVATQKFDGTCLLNASVSGWYARREVKPGKLAPANYVAIETDPNTGKTVGWEPIEQSSFVEAFWEAMRLTPKRVFPEGTYELCGPKVNGNPEGLKLHHLIEHAKATRLNMPRDFDGLRDCLEDFPGEGVVWHHEDGRMCKIKRRDFGYR